MKPNIFSYAVSRRAILSVLAKLPTLSGTFLCSSAQAEVSRWPQWPHGRQSLVRVLTAALLGLDIAILGCATSYSAHSHFADATGMQGNQQEKHRDDNLCGWIGVAVSPMTAAFAESLGMVEPYGAIFGQPESGGPAAAAHIEQGDVLTAINGSPLMRSTDFAEIISVMAPNATVYLDTRRDGVAMQIKVILGSAPCRAPG